MQKTYRGPSAWPGVRRGNDKQPGWKVATPTAPRGGGEVFSRKSKVEQIQHTKDKILPTDPYLALYHITRAQGTRAAPRL